MRRRASWSCSSRSSASSALASAILSRLSADPCTLLGIVRASLRLIDPLLRQCFCFCDPLLRQFGLLRSMLLDQTSLRLHLLDAQLRRPDRLDRFAGDFLRFLFSMRRTLLAGLHGFSGLIDQGEPARSIRMCLGDRDQVDDVAVKCCATIRSHWRLLPIFLHRSCPVRLKEPDERSRCIYRVPSLAVWGASLGILVERRPQGLQPR